MKKLLLLPTIILSAVLFFVSCSKEDSPSTPEKEGPSILSFTPLFGEVGETIWITGKNFGSTSSANTVKIGSVVAPISSSSTTEIFVTVPEGAVSGAISVTVDGETDTAGGFTVMESLPENSISLNKNTLELFTLDSETLIPTIVGTATAADIEWTSKDEAIAIVDENGKVTGVAEGSVIITADLGNDAYVECMIKVNPSVFISGREDNGNDDIAMIWKNGTPINLTDGSAAAQANSIFVNGTDIYVAGQEIEGSKEVAKLWKNGQVLYNLTDGTENAYAYSVVANNTDVYVAGREANNESFNTFSKIWKNGQLLYNLTDGSKISAVYSLFLNNTDIYAAGFERNENGMDIAKLWKNGVVTNITDGSNSAKAYSVYVDGNDVYVAGNEETENGATAKIWKNGVPLYNLTDGSTYSYAISLVVKGTDVYAAGAEGNALFVWKNGQILYNLTDGTNPAIANSIFINGTDIYVAGYEESVNAIDTAKMWKNGVATNLSDGVTPARAFSVFVK
ncbi:IPT/TIG domain-containing protein [Flagellimonas eckloniae]|uniref:IPT/TIG domain-containing protein n=1 Tax=Flagellimonas eckloniae TaxID=346185 RepID=UPI0006DD197E|nr:IPT/TIG domain-containing protein [Allomuricauda eckloniae]